MEQEEVPPPRRLVGIDLGITSRHSVRVPTDQEARSSGPSERAQLTGPSHPRKVFNVLARATLEPPAAYAIVSVLTGGASKSVISC